MTHIKAFVRLSKRLQQAWPAHRSRNCSDGWHELDCISQKQGTLQKAWQLLQKAEQRNLVSIRPQLEQQLLRRLQDVRDALASLGRQFERSPAAIPGMALLVAELQAIEKEFGDLRIDWNDKFVSATTEPITLEDVELGPFAIQLHWERLATRHDAGCFEIVALEPNPAAPNDLVTHPHVRDQHLCAGEAARPLAQALESGRLSDAFMVVRSVLRTYNAGSPHVRLDEWCGHDCHDCGATIGDDDSYHCEACGDDYCEQCTPGCAACSATRCNGCVEPCAVCEESCCAGCLKESAHSKRACCSNCLATCAGCQLEVATDQLSEASLCPACVKAEAATAPNIRALSEHPDNANPENTNATILASSFSNAL